MWRQGHALSVESISAIFPEAEPKIVVAVVISHDCDLACDPAIDPAVEVIFGRWIDSANGNFSHAKNPRRLHLPATFFGKSTTIELVAAARRSILKERFAGHFPEANFEIAPADRDTLQRWLAARYRRSAFPDLFDSWLKESGIERRLASILAPEGSHIIAIFFDVDGGSECEHKGVDDPFTLSIYVLYSTSINPIAAEKVADIIAKKIVNLFRDRCYDVSRDAWRWIELLDCEPISDEVLTFKLSQSLKRWNIDYVSLRAEPNQPIFES